MLDLDLIERVEIIRGPSSSIYGTSAYFAVVNIVTKTPADVAGLTASASAASYETYSGRVAFGTPRESRWQVLAAASRYYSRGQDLYFAEYDTPATNDGVAVGLDDDDATRVFASARRGPFTLEGGYLERKKRIPTGAWQTIFNDPGSRTTDLRSFLDLRFERSILETGAVAGRVYLDRYWYSGTYVYDAPPPVQYFDYGEGEWWGVEGTVAAPVSRAQKLLVGFEFRDNFEQAQGSWDIDPRSVNFDDTRRSNVWALYAQDEVRLSPGLTASGGVRYDHFDSFGGTTNPRLGAILTVNPTTVVKLLYGRAFRRPNEYELYYLAYGQKANPALRPERISTYETVVERRLGRNLRATLSGYRYDVKGIAEWVLDPTDSLYWFQNRGRANASGIETEVEGRTAAGLVGRASYAYQFASDGESGAELTNSPRHLLKLNLSLPVLGGKLFAGMETQYVGPRTTLQGGRAGDYVVTNLTLLERSWWKRVEVSASLYNAFDRRYAVPAGEEHVQSVIPQDGRNGRVELRIRL